MPLIVALLGAESTGKTDLSLALAPALSALGHRVAVVPEYLREFCEARGRTPRADEQQGIAEEQTRRVQAAAATHDVVIADTTALMVAVYSDMIFGDPSLYALGLAQHAPAVLSLLLAADLPWVADGILRDGPHVREPVTRLLRAALVRGGVSYSVISGAGPARLDAAMNVIQHRLEAPDLEREARLSPKWQWNCDRCSDGDCERHLRLPR